MAALAVKTLPEGEEWLYELKWDGYRALLIKDGEDVQSAPGTTRT
jgi:ATP-dependent DNA ligase